MVLPFIPRILLIIYHFPLPKQAPGRLFCRKCRFCCIGYTRHDTLRFATAEPNYALYLITAPTAAEVAKKFRQLIGPSYIPPKWAFGLAQSRFGYKTEADIRKVAQPAANTAQLNDTALTFWRFAPDGLPAPYRMYTDDGVTTDHNKPEHWRIVGQ